MKPLYLMTSVVSLLLAGGGFAFAGDAPVTPTSPAIKKIAPMPPARKQELQNRPMTEGQKQGLNIIAKAQVRPTHATHSARPGRNWCNSESTSPINGRVELYYNYPGPPGGPQLAGVLVVNTNDGMEHRTNVTIYRGMNEMATSDSLKFRWQDVCPPVDKHVGLPIGRVGVRLMAQNPAENSQFMPVIVYAAPDRLDSPTWY